MIYDVNKGVGQPLEFKGLKGSALLTFGVGITAVILISLILGMLSAPAIAIIIVGFGGGGSTLYLSYYINEHYGRYGLMKLRASRLHPTYIRNNRRISTLLKR